MRKEICSKAGCTGKDNRKVRRGAATLPIREAPAGWRKQKVQVSRKVLHDAENATTAPTSPAPVGSKQASQTTTPSLPSALLDMWSSPLPDAPRTPQKESSSCHPSQNHPSSPRVSSPTSCTSLSLWAVTEDLEPGPSTPLFQLSDDTSRDETLTPSYSLLLSPYSHREKTWSPGVSPRTSLDAVMDGAQRTLSSITTSFMFCGEDLTQPTSPPREVAQLEPFLPRLSPPSSPDRFFRWSLLDAPDYPLPRLCEFKKVESPVNLPSQCLGSSRLNTPLRCLVRPAFRQMLHTPSPPAGYTPASCAAFFVESVIDNLDFPWSSEETDSSTGNIDFGLELSCLYSD